MSPGNRLEICLVGFVDTLPGTPNHTWLRATESDLRPLDISPYYGWNKATAQENWRSIVDMAMLENSMP